MINEEIKVKPQRFWSENFFVLFRNVKNWIDMKGGTSG